MIHALFFRFFVEYLISGPNVSEIENRALGPIVQAQAFVGWGIYYDAACRGKPCELHVVLNSPLSRCCLDLMARDALAVNLLLKS